jgi:hypothetical protein
MDRVIRSLKMKREGLFTVSLIMISCLLILNLWALVSNNKVRIKIELMRFNKLLEGKKEYLILLRSLLFHQFCKGNIVCFILDLNREILKKLL